MRKLRVPAVRAQGAGSVAKRKKPGRKRHITMAVVERVAERFGLGLSLAMALVLEKDACINEDSWKKALLRNPEFVPPFAAAKADFYDRAVRKLASCENPKYLCWLLERRHSDEFHRPPDQLDVSQIILGVPDDFISRLRDYAKSR